VTLEVSVPVHEFGKFSQPPPDQPRNREPGSGVAVMVMTLPAGKLALQVPTLQSIPGGFDVTLPLAREVEIVTDKTGGARPNAAPTDMLRVIVRMQLPVPWQSPDQPRNTCPGSVFGNSVTVWLKL
jgi:hypothetical protein